MRKMQDLKGVSLECCEEDGEVILTFRTVADGQAEEIFDDLAEMLRKGRIEINIPGGVSFGDDEERL